MSGKRKKGKEATENNLNKIGRTHAKTSRAGGFSFAKKAHVRANRTGSDDRSLCHMTQRIRADITPSHCTIEHGKSAAERPTIDG